MKETENNMKLRLKLSGQIYSVSGPKKMLKTGDDQLSRIVTDQETGEQGVWAEDNLWDKFETVDSLLETVTELKQLQKLMQSFCKSIKHGRRYNNEGLRNDIVESAIAIVSLSYRAKV